MTDSCSDAPTASTGNWGITKSLNSLEGNYVHRQLPFSWSSAEEECSAIKAPNISNVQRKNRLLYEV